MSAYPITGDLRNITPLPTGADPEPSSWDTFKAHRIDLGRAIAEGVERPGHLVEPVLLLGKVHVIFGGPEQGKTLLLLHLVLRVLRQGGRVLYLDEEVGIAETAERLAAMGATDRDLCRLDYFAFGLAGSLEAQGATIIEGVLREGYNLVALDSLSKAFGAAGLDENSNTDATKLMRAWITPAAHRHGATVLLLDHVTKAEDDRRYGRGASSKLADTDVQWHIQAAVAPSRTSMGRLVLTKKKDRTATLPATVRYTAGGDGTGAINIALEDTPHVPTMQANRRDGKYVHALCASGNTGMTFAAWHAAAGGAKSSFADARRRLVNNGTVIFKDDLYIVAPHAIHACPSKDETPTTPALLGTGRYG